LAGRAAANGFGDSIAPGFCAWPAIGFATVAAAADGLELDEDIRKRARASASPLARTIEPVNATAKAIRNTRASLRWRQFKRRHG
jgi:hypothetical protein